MVECAALTRQPLILWNDSKINRYPKLVNKNSIDCSKDTGSNPVLSTYEQKRNNLYC